MNTGLTHPNHPALSSLSEASLSFQWGYELSRRPGKGIRVSIPPTMWCVLRARAHSITTFILLHQSAGIHFIHSQTVGKYAIRWTWQEAAVHIMFMNIIPIDFWLPNISERLIPLYQIPLKAYNFQWVVTLAALHSHWQPSGGMTPENTLCLSRVCRLIYSA